MNDLSAQPKASGMPSVRLVKTFCTCVSSCVNSVFLNLGLCICTRIRVQL
jgi:hypothetical protein